MLPTNNVRFPRMGNQLTDKADCERAAEESFSQFTDQFNDTIEIDEIYQAAESATTKEQAYEAVLCQIIIHFDTLNFEVIDHTNIKESNHLSMPGNLQEAIVVLIMSARDEYDLSISPNDVIDALGNLKAHLKSTTEIKQAVDDYLDLGDVDSCFLTKGLRLYNQKQNTSDKYIFISDAAFSIPMLNLLKFNTSALDLGLSIPQANRTVAPSFNMPDDLQEVLVMLIMFKKEKNDSSISLNDIIDVLSILEPVPDLDIEMKYALADYKRYADLDLLLMKGVQLYNKRQSDLEKHIILKTNWLKILPDDLLPFKNSFLHFEDQLIFSSTCKHYFKMHERLLRLKLTTEGELERKLPLIEISAKEHFRKNPQHRIPSCSVIDQQGINDLQTYFNCGPRAIRKIANGELTIDKAMQEAKDYAESNEKVWDEFEYLNDKQFGVLQKYIIDGAITIEQIKNMSEDEIHAFTNALANKSIQKCIDNSTLEIKQPINITELVAFSAVLGNGIIKKALNNGHLKIKQLTNLPDIEEFSRVLNTKNIQIFLNKKCKYAELDISIQDILQATEAGAKTLCYLSELKLKPSMRLPPGREILRLSDIEKNIICNRQMQLIMFAHPLDKPVVSLEEILALSPKVKQALQSKTIQTYMSHHCDCKNDAERFFEEFRMSTDAGAIAISNPVWDLLSKIKCGSLSLQQILQSDEEDLACLANDNNLEAYVKMRNTKCLNEESCIIS